MDHGDQSGDVDCHYGYQSDGHNDVHNGIEGDDYDVGGLSYDSNCSGSGACESGATDENCLCLCPCLIILIISYLIITCSRVFCTPGQAPKL